MYSILNGRNTRTKTPMYSQMHHPFANYCTEALQKGEMKLDYENELFLNNLHLIPDPLMKNLADTLVTSEKPEKVKKQSLETPTMPLKPKEDVRPESALAGIANFFSGVFSMLSGAVFRTRSPDDYYDCFDAEVRQGSPPSWRSANSDQDKNGQMPEKCVSDGPVPNGVQSDMNNSQVSSCEEKINQVRSLLSPKPKPSTPVWRKRPKKVFVEPGTVEDSFEDAFSPEDFVTLSSKPYIEYYSPTQYQNEELCETEAPKAKIEVAPVKETTEIVKEVIVSETNDKQEESCDLKPENDTVKVDSDNIAIKNLEEDSGDDKQQLVSSCEDKLSKLKALLQEKRAKPPTIIEQPPEPVTEQPKPAKTIPIAKPVDKHFKNPHRMLDKRRKMKLKRSIQDDVIFANEIDLESPVESPSTPSTLSSDTSLGDYFDEMKGRFRSTSATESEDSFQIVFNDTPKRTHKASDCESEDSFIVFEDDCYTSNDVFGDSDSESDVSDSGCSTMTCKLSHSLSRTVSNLTDDTLYESSDEVDCAKVEPVEARGLLMDATRKSLKKSQPAKKVHFSTEPPTVKVMRVWAFAARQARAGHWERYALDRDRFKRRIADVDMAVSWVLKPQHRSRVMFQRFMPLWNRQKRQELAEKKEREAEEKRLEAQRLEEKRVQEEKEALELENSKVNTVNGDTKNDIDYTQARESLRKLQEKKRRGGRKGQNVTKKDETESKNLKGNFKNSDIKSENGYNKIDIETNNNKILNIDSENENIKEITDKLELSKLVESVNLDEDTIIGT